MRVLDRCCNAGPAPFGRVIGTPLDILWTVGDLEYASDCSLPDLLAVGGSGRGGEPRKGPPRPRICLHRHLLHASMVNCESAERKCELRLRIA